MLRSSLLTFVLVVACNDDPSPPDAEPMQSVDGSAAAPSIIEAGRPGDSDDIRDSGDRLDAQVQPHADAGHDSSTPPVSSGIKHCAPLFSVHSNDSQEAASGECHAIPPDCETGTVAELYTADDVARDCWTGRCLPAQECDLVNDCRDCAADTYCYITDDEGNTWQPPGADDETEFRAQNLVRVECLPLDECPDGKCDDCEEIFCHGGCGNGPLRSEYDNDYTGNLVDHSDGAFICTTYDG